MDAPQIGGEIISPALDLYVIDAILKAGSALMRIVLGFLRRLAQYG
ncbi:hypothetical protein [uncultured Desulfobulbus sp.]|nr:hypothetical protein [uncultured Desulfobulbus sp.]